MRFAGLGMSLQIAQQFFESGVREKTEIIDRLREHIRSAASRVGYQ